MRPRPSRGDWRPGPHLFLGCIVSGTLTKLRTEYIGGHQTRTLRRQQPLGKDVKQSSQRQTKLSIRLNNSTRAPCMATMTILTAKVHRNHQTTRYRLLALLLKGEIIKAMLVTTWIGIKELVSTTTSLPRCDVRSNYHHIGFLLNRPSTASRTTEYSRSKPQSRRPLEGARIPQRCGHRLLAG